MCPYLTFRGKITQFPAYMVLIFGSTTKTSQSIFLFPRDFDLPSGVKELHQSDSGLIPGAFLAVRSWDDRMWPKDPCFEPRTRWPSWALFVCLFVCFDEGSVEASMSYCMFFVRRIVLRRDQSSTWNLKPLQTLDSPSTIFHQNCFDRECI